MNSGLRQEDLMSPVLFNLKSEKVDFELQDVVLLY